MLAALTVRDIVLIESAALEFAPRLFGKRKGLFEAGLGRGDRLARALVHARQPLEGCGQRGFGTALTTQRFRRRGNIFGDTRGIHQQHAFGGQRHFFTLLGPERRELVHRSGDIVRIRRRLGRDAPQFGFRLARAVQGYEALGSGAGESVVAAKGIEHNPMCRRIEQTAVVGLAMDFEQQPAQILQQRHANRLIIDESAGPPVGGERAAQHDLAIGRHVLLA